MTQLSPENLDRAFALLVECAVKGERCPTSAGPDAHHLLSGGEISALARAGRIRSEVSGRNFRQVTVLTGPHAGKKTAPNPNKNARVYIVMDGAGTKRDVSSDHRPSAPRSLTAAELRR
jgi:hypothetical protein